MGGCSGIGGGEKPLNSCVNDGPSCSGRYFYSRYFSFRYPEHFLFFSRGKGIKHDHLRYQESLVIKTYCNKTMNRICILYRNIYIIYIYRCY